MALTNQEAEKLLSEINYLAYKIYTQASEDFKEKCGFDFTKGIVCDSKGNTEIETVFLKFSFHYGQTNI
jgi:hypothetical protein